MPRLKHNIFLNFFKKSFRVFFISSLFSVFGYISFIYLARVLTESEFGLFALVLSLANFIVTIGSFGQPDIIKRAYIQNRTYSFDYITDIFISLIFVSPILVLLLFGQYFLYNHDFETNLYLSSYVILLFFITIVSKVIDANQHYEFATFLQRLPNSLLIIPVLLSFYIIDFTPSVEWFFRALLIILIFTILSGIVFTTKKIPRGSQCINLAKRYYGYNLLLFSLGQLIILDGLIVLAGKLFQPAIVAAYAAMALLIKPFYLIQNVIFKIVYVETAINKKFPHKKVIQFIFLISIAITAGLIIFHDQIAELIYRQKFNNYYNLLIPLFIIAFLLITESFPRGFIIGNVVSSKFNHYIYIQLLVTILGVFIAIYYHSYFGIHTIAWAGVFIMIIRNLISYTYYRRFRRIDTT